MNCPKCGEADVAKYRFCPICATPVERPAEPTVTAAAAKPGGTAGGQGARAAARPGVTPGRDKDHLFETVEKKTESRRSYAKLFAVVAVAVVIAGFAIAYLTLLPGRGDKVKASTGMELAIRDHFLMVQKRTATDIETYYCGDFYWARVGVETRTDIPNPLLRVRTYAARAVSPADSAWNVTAAPIASPEMDEPCR